MPNWAKVKAQGGGVAELRRRRATRNLDQFVMFYSRLILIAAALTLSIPAFAQLEGSQGNATLVRCTQQSESQGLYRYNVRIVKSLNSGNIYADLHSVNKHTNFGQSIF